MVTVSLGDKPRGRLFLIAFPALLVLLFLWWQAGLWYGRHLGVAVRSQIAGALAERRHLLAGSVERRLSLLKGLRGFVGERSLTDIPAAEFATYAAGLVAGAKGVRSVSVAPGGVVFLVHPGETADQLSGLDLLQDKRQAVRSDAQRAVRLRRPILGGPYLLPGKVPEMVARQAVFRGEEFLGLLSVTFDARPLFVEAGLDPLPNGLEVLLQDKAGNVLYGNRAVLEATPVTAAIDVPDGPWRLSAAPKGGWEASTAKGLWEFRLASGIIAMLAFSLVFLLASHRLRLESAVRRRTEELHRLLADHRQEQEAAKRSLTSLRRALGGALEASALAVEAKEPLAAGHHRRAADLARAIATEMGLEKERIEMIRLGAGIHDLGKITIPAEVLNKTGPLSEAEQALIKTHPERGYEILRDVDLWRPVSLMVRQHHERLDGSGYPLGLKGEGIVLEARILAVADVVEAMASPRIYRPLPGLEAALQEIKDNRGRLYDPQVVDACLRIFREKDFRLE